MTRGLLLVCLLVVPVWAADWAALDRYQCTITRAQFLELLTNVYCPSAAITNYLTLTPTNVLVHADTSRSLPPVWQLQFAPQPAPPPAPPQTLPHVRIALDPGHIGGAWARMEQRWFQRGTDPPVQEAVLNLTVARLLRQQLQAAGATVFLTKDNFEPVSTERPAYCQATNRFIAVSAADANAAAAARLEEERQFYRNAEIAARARLVNEQFRPDLTLCLHFNAAEWNECHDLVEDNRLVVFVHGNYLPAELADEQQRYRLFAKLLEQSHATELAVAEALADALAAATGLPPVEYATNSAALRIGTNRFVYARNLAANRLINGPVVFLEPYYQNNRLVYQRIQWDDYDGSRELAGRLYPSIFREYAGAVFAGLRRVYPAALRQP